MDYTEEEDDNEIFGLYATNREIDEDGVGDTFSQVISQFFVLFGEKPYVTPIPFHVSS